MNWSTQNANLTVASSVIAGGADIVEEKLGPNPAWDRFLARLNGGHHTQLSSWAAARASLGWQAHRIIIAREDGIIGGIQLLLRRLPLLGKVCYAPHGPVLKPEYGQYMAPLVRKAYQVARSERARLLMIQPPVSSLDWIQMLREHGFHKSSIGLGPTATVIVDLDRKEEEILAAMKARVRRNIRLAEKNGLKFRVGDEQDLSLFHAMLEATSERQGFSIFPQSYYRELWRLLAPSQNIRLSLVTHEAEVVSAQLDILFGDTVTNNISVWSGKHRQFRPNDFLQWSVIRASKQAGFSYYDQEGIEPSVARAVLHNEPIPEVHRNSVSSFKLGFGGRVMLKPVAYEYFYSPLLRPLWNHALPRLGHATWFKRWLNRMRTRAASGDASGLDKEHEARSK